MFSRPTVFVSIILALALAMGLVLAYNDTKTSTEYNAEDIQNWEAGINPQFAAYVTSYTGGFRSRLKPISIHLADPVADSGQIGKEIPSGWFSISPNIEGKAIFTDPQTIEFQPTKALDFGTRYDVKLNTDAIFSIEDPKLKSFEFPLFTPKGGIAFLPQSWKSQSSTDYSKQNLAVELFFTDVLSLEEISKSIKVSQDNKNLEFTIEKTNNPLQPILTIKGIERSEEDGIVKVLISGENIGLEGERKTEISIPSINVHKLYSYHQDPENPARIILHYTDPVKEETKFLKLQFDEYSISNINVSGSDVSIDVKSNYEYDGRYVKINPSNLFYNTENSLFSCFEFIVSTTSSNGSSVELSVKEKGIISPEAEHKLIQFRAKGLKSVLLTLMPIAKDRLLEAGINNSNDNAIGSGSYYGENTISDYGRATISRKIYLGAGERLNYKNLETYQIDLQKYVFQSGSNLWGVQISYNEEDIYDQQNPDNPTKVDGLNTLNHPDAFSWSDSELSKDLDIRALNNDYYDEDSGEWISNNKSGEVSMLVMFTDIALIAKKSSQDHLHIFTLNIETGSVKPNTQITLYNNQKLPIANLISNAKGYAEYTGSKIPLYILATNNGRSSFLSLKTSYDGESEMRLNSYDITGSYKGRPASFMYTDRDIYRPGDSVFLSMIFPAATEETSITNQLPAIINISDPTGNVVYTHAVARNNKSIHTLKIPTLVNQITGKYKAICSIANLTSTIRFSLETIKPNRLDVNLRLDKKTVIGNAATTAILSGRWLYGADASNLDASIEANIGAKSPPTVEFGKYSFYSPEPLLKLDPVIIFKGKLDQKGATNASLDFAKLALKEPRRLQLSSRIYEESGDYSTEVSLVDYYPYSTIPGININGLKNSSAYDSKAPIKVNVVNLDILTSKPSPLPTQFYLKVFQNKDESWIDNQGSNSNYNFENDKKLVFTQVISVTSEGQLTLDALKDLKMKGSYGNFTFEITDANGYSISIPVNLSEYGSNEEENFDNNEYRPQPSASQLSNIRTDKENYQSGDKAKITFSAPGRGTAIITVERDRQVLTYLTASCIAGVNTVEVPITGEMAPNAYILIHLVYPYSNLNVLLTSYNYGLVPINVTHSGSHLVPVIKAPEKANLGQDITVSISEKSNKAMEYTLAVVDEGLLNMTRFKTPDPFDYFYAKHPLNILNFHNLSWIKGREQNAIEIPLAPGGDGYLSSADMAALNVRFKSYVRYLGPYKLKAGETAKHNFKSEEFAGTVRLMVVAASERSYGQAEAKVILRSDLLVQGNAPRILAPDDVAAIPANLINLGKLKNATVSITVEGPATISGSKSATVNFLSSGRGLTQFMLRAGKTTGQVKLKMTATSGEFKHYWSAIIPVRYANPATTEAQTLEIEAGKSITTALKPFGLPNTNKASMEVSTLPQVSLTKHTEYLIGYPYGCMEQTISSGFGQALLTRMASLNETQKTAALFNIEKALVKLNVNKVENKMLPYWPGTSRADYLVSAYEFLFRNYLVSKKVLPNLTLRNQESYFPTSLSLDLNRSEVQEAIGLAHIIHIYTNDRIDNGFENYFSRLEELPSKNQTAALLIAAGVAKLNPDKARKLIGSYTNYKLSNSFISSSMTNDALLLMTACGLNDKSSVHQLAEKVAKNIESSPFYNTFSLAFSLLAMEQYNTQYGNVGNASLSFSANNTTESINIGNKIELRQYKSDSPSTFIMKNTGDKPLFVTLSRKGIPARSQEKSNSSNLNLDVKYVDENGAPINPASLPTGSSIVAVVKVSAKSALQEYDNLALNFMLPAGWEAVNRRIEGGQDESVHLDQRDDRVLFFFSLNKNQVREIRIPIKAVYTGQFYLPAIKCEHMYQPRSVFAVQAGMPVNVVGKMVQ